jgi:hypothetical protein
MKLIIPILAVFGILAAAPAAQAATFYTSTSGTPTGSCTSQADSCTLTRALAMAAAGDTVLVSGQVSASTASVPAGVTVQGNRPASGELPEIAVANLEVRSNVVVRDLAVASSTNSTAVISVASGVPVSGVLIERSALRNVTLQLFAYGVPVSDILVRNVTWTVTGQYDVPLNFQAYSQNNVYATIRNIRLNHVTLDARAETASLYNYNFSQAPCSATDQPVELSMSNSVVLSGSGGFGNVSAYGPCVNHSIRIALDHVAIGQPLPPESANVHVTQSNVFTSDSYRSHANFVDYAGGNFGLVDGSVLADAGAASNVTDDADANPRNDGRPDLGAFELPAAPMLSSIEATGVSMGSATLHDNGSVFDLNGGQAQWTWGLFVDQPNYSPVYDAPAGMSQTPDFQVSPTAPYNAYYMHLHAWSASNYGRMRVDRTLKSFWVNPGPTVAGPAGQDGAAGATGSTGATGAQGTSGATGATGTAGVAGAAGSDGMPGATGTAGAAGAAGATGATGATGAPGTDGQDASGIYPYLSATTAAYTRTVAYRQARLGIYTGMNIKAGRGQTQSFILTTSSCARIATHGCVKLGLTRQVIVPGSRTRKIVSTFSARGRAIIKRRKAHGLHTTVSTMITLRPVGGTQTTLKLVQRKTIV